MATPFDMLVLTDLLDKYAPHGLDSLAAAAFVGLGPNHPA